jgi:hypothetical protein
VQSFSIPFFTSGALLQACLQAATNKPINGPVGLPLAGKTLAGKTRQRTVWLCF